MSHPPPSSYIDRRSGRTIEDPIHAPRFLHWSYNSRIGWWLTDVLFSWRPVSWLYGWFHRRRWSRGKIGPFIEAMAVDRSELVRPPECYRSFDDFITRTIDLSKRPIERDPAVCVSPADGRVLVYPELPVDATLTIKRAIFDLPALLRNQAMATAYAGGAAAIIRLYLADYHHFHFPAEGVSGAPRTIPGRYFAVTPYSKRRLVPFYGQNARTITVLDSDRFGRIAMVEVGAFTVGSIQQSFAPGERVAKGDQKGLFGLGGSIVVLLFEPGAIAFDSDLRANSEVGLETYVRLGESLGRSARP